MERVSDSVYTGLFLRFNLPFKFLSLFDNLLLASRVSDSEIRFS